jgi:phage protein D
MSIDKSALLSEVEVTINGTTMTKDFEMDLLQVTVESSLHLPDVATLVLYDADLTWVNNTTLDPGKSVRILLSARKIKQPIFDGEIVEIEPDFDQSVQRLTVRAFDRMHRLARGQHVRSFINVSDSDLFNQLAQEVGLQVQMDPATLVYPYVFQNNETNLAFLHKRAASLGYLLYVKGTTLYCKAPTSSQPPQELTWRAGLSEFHPRLTTIEQVNSIAARGWNPAQKQPVVGRLNPSSGVGAPAIGQSANGGAVAQKAFSVNAELLIADRPIRRQALADQLTKAAANRQAGRFIEAEGACYGNPTLIAGASVNIKGVGNRFSGTYYITNALHNYSAHGGYSTRFSVSGYEPSALLDLLIKNEDTDKMAGLFIGIVTDNNDPDGQGRVKVKYPWLSEEHASDWARVIAPGVGNQRGIEFLPEVNDEVLVGFEMGDIHYPYVLGGLWNGQDAIPERVTSGSGNIQKRIIRSRTGHIITLDDSEGGGGITIADSAGNQIMLDTQTNKLSISVKGDASIQAQGNLTLEATGQLQLKGTAGVSVESSANLDVKGTAIVNIKGTLVNIN